MAEKNLKEKTIAGMAWSAFGKFGVLGLTFITNMVLARLLMPQDFGCIGMLNIFIAVSEVFVLGGFGQALIQKKHPSNIDYNTVFLWNLIVALLMYSMLFISAPYIARFYNMYILKAVLRVQSITLIISAFSMVQSTQLTKNLQFKQLAVRNVISTLAGPCVSVPMAFLGFGVWSLVAANIISKVLGVILLWKLSDWRPNKAYSASSLKELFSFGGLMALSSLIEKLYVNIQGLVIGRWYSASDLGYYSQARKLEQMPTDALSQIVGEVSFPVFSSIQDDKHRLLLGVRKNITTITYLNFPMSILLIVIATPLIHLLYGPNWDASIPYFKIFCLNGLIYTVNTMNTNIVKSLGKSKVYFFVQLFKRIVGLVLIICGARYGVIGLVWSVATTAYINFLINTIVNKRLLGYGFWYQLKDVSQNLICSIIAGAAAYALGKFALCNQYIVLILQILLFCLVYWIESMVLKIESYYTYREIIFKYIKR